MFMDLSEPLEVIWPESVALRPYREDEDDVLMWDTMRAGFGDDWDGPTERDEWLRTHRGAGLRERSLVLRGAPCWG
jgi:hypothetical protein